MFSLNGVGKANRSFSIFFMIVFCSASLFAQSRGISAKKTAAKSKNSSKLEIGIPKIKLKEEQMCDAYSVAFSPDSRIVAAGYSTGEIVLWDSTTGALVRKIKAHDKAVWSVAFSRDGKMVVSGGEDGLIKCWYVSNGSLIRTLEGHEGGVSFVTFNTVGSVIASCSADKTVRLWQSDNGRLLDVFKDHSNTIAAIDYNADDTLVASASWGKTAQIKYVIGSKILSTLNGHAGEVFAVEFSPNGKTIATGSGDNTIRIWNPETGTEIKTLAKMDGEVLSIRHSPNGKLLAAGDSTGSVKIWNVETGEIVSDLKGHEKSVKSLCFDGQGKKLYSGDSEGIIKIWNVENSELVATILNCKDGGWVTWTPDGFLNASDDAIKFLSYSVDGREYPLWDIKETVYRPEILSSRLGGGKYKEKNEKTLADIVMESRYMDIKFEISNIDGSPRIDNKQRDIMTNITVTNNGNGIGRVLIKLNGRSFQVSDGVRTDKSGTYTISQSSPLSLSSGNNTVSVVVYNSLGTVYAESDVKEIVWEGESAKARLFVLAVGINNYADKSIQNLSNCVKDATAFVGTAINHSGDLYLDVFSNLITDEKVTKASLPNEIEEFGKAVEPDDVFILYLAGHGVTDGDDYYFIPSDFKNRGSNALKKYAVSKWELLEALSTIKTQSICVILDTCNSDSFDTSSLSKTPFDYNEANAVLTKFGVLGGFDLLTASSTYQVAMDNYNGHGLFTYWLISGIEGSSDLDRNGQITSQELSSFLIKEVPVRSYERYGYRQEPQSVNGLKDHPMFGKLNPKPARSLADALEIAKLIDANGLSVEEATKRLNTEIGYDERAIILDSGGSVIGAISVGAQHGTTSAETKEAKITSNDKNTFSNTKISDTWTPNFNVVMGFSGNMGFDNSGIRVGGSWFYDLFSDWWVLTLEAPLMIYPIDIGFNVHSGFGYFKSDKFSIFVSSGGNLSVRSAAVPLNVGLYLGKLRILNSFQYRWNFFDFENSGFSYELSIGWPYFTSGWAAPKTSQSELKPSTSKPKSTPDSEKTKPTSPPKQETPSPSQPKQETPKKENKKPHKPLELKYPAAFIFDGGAFLSGVSGAGFITDVNFQVDFTKRHALRVGVPLRFSMSEMPKTTGFEIGIMPQYVFNIFPPKDRMFGLWVGGGIDLSTGHFALPITVGGTWKDMLELTYSFTWNFKGYFEDTIKLGFILPIGGKK